jgi:hypothetical protein
MLPFGLFTVASESTVRTSSSDPRRIDLHAYGGFLLAADQNLADAGNLAQLLAQHVLRVIIHRGQRQLVGPDGDQEDGRIGRVHLSEGRLAGQVLRQLSLRRVDRLEHIGRGRIDVARQVELHGDRR